MEPGARPDGAEEERGLTEKRKLAVAFLAASIAGALSVNSPTGLSLVALSLVSLIAGYRNNIAATAAVAGLFLYYPFATAMGHLVPGFWGYMLAGGALIILSERLSFEYHLSTGPEAQLGVDEESRRLAGALSKSHAIRLVWFGAMATTVAGLAFLATSVTKYTPLLAAASVLLVFALWGYSRR